MNNKIKVLIEILLVSFLSAGIMIGLKMFSPEYGEYIFWVGFSIVFLYFAYTYKLALLELEEFYKSLQKKNE